MKSKLYRVLVLLVAIAMMIPSFALAEETTTPKVEWTAFTGEDFSVKLTSNLINEEYFGKDGSTPFTYAVTDTTGEGYHVEWKSDKPAVASVTEDEPVLVDNVPAIVLHTLGEATITGTLVNNYGEKNSVTKSFKVTVIEEPVTKFELTKKTAKVMLSSSTYPLDNLINTSTIEPTNATYADSDNFEWSITKGGDCARLMSNNVLELKKAGTVELSVKAKGASTAAAQTFALTILDSEEADPTEVGYSKITFTTKSIDEDTNNIEVSKYLKIEKPADFTDDEVVWTSSDESIASVNVTPYGVYVEFFVDEGSVVITAASKVGSTKPDTITVNYKKAEKNVYETVKFDNGDVTVDADREAYTVTVTATPRKKGDAQDTLIYTVHTDGGKDSQVAIAEKYYDWEEYETVDTKATISWDSSRITEEKKVVVKVRSKNNPAAEDQFTLTIKPVVAKPIKTITLTQTDFTLKWSYPWIDLSDYVDIDPVDYKNDGLEFISDREDHVKVKKEYDEIDEEIHFYAYVDDDCVPGKAVITVRSKKGEAEPKTFNIEYVKDGVITSAKFVGAPTEITPNYNYDEDYDVDLAKYLTVEPSYYELSELDLYWDSSNPQVATVNDKGRVTVEGIGNVTITVSDKTGKELAKHTMKVSAKYPLVEKVELKDITLKVGDNLNLYTTDNFMNWTPRDAKCKDIKWVSSNRDVAEVQGNIQISNESNRLTEGFYIVAYKAGETTITVNVENHDGTVKTASCKVTVTDVEAESVEFAAKQYTLKLNTKLTAKVRFNLVPYNASADDLYIVTNNPDVIELGTTGYWDEEDHYVTEDFTVKNGKGYVTITAVKPGKAWIGIRRASDDKELGSVKVVVETVKVKRFKLPKNSITLNWYDDGKPTSNAVANYTYKNSYTVEPVITPSKAYYTVSYETSDPSVAFVADRSELEGDSAKIVASGVGKCTITVKVDDGKKVRVSKLKVTVVGKTPKPVIDQKKATINMNKGEKSITLNVYDADTKEALKVTWASSDNKVAKVNKNGKVTAVGAGKATITATHKDTGKTLKCIVTVKAKSTENADKVKKITGDAKVSVKVGEKKTLNIKVKPAGAKVTFKSSDTSIVKVGKDGQIKGVKAGKATITVSGDGVEFKIKVTVKK